MSNNIILIRIIFNRKQKRMKNLENLKFQDLVEISGGEMTANTSLGYDIAYCATTVCKYAWYVLRNG